MKKKPQFNNIITSIITAVQVYRLAGLHEGIKDDKYLHIGLGAVTSVMVYGLLTTKDRFLQKLLGDGKSKEDNALKSNIGALSVHCFAMTQALFTSVYVWRGASSSLASIVSHLEVFYAVKIPFFSMFFYGLSWIDPTFETVSYALRLVPNVDDFYSKLFLSSTVFITSYFNYKQIADQTIGIKDIEAYFSDYYLKQMLTIVKKGGKPSLDEISDFRSFLMSIVEPLRFLEFKGNVFSCFALYNTIFTESLSEANQNLCSFSRGVHSILYSFISERSVAIEQKEVIK